MRLGSFAPFALAATTGCATISGLFAPKTPAPSAQETPLPANPTFDDKGGQKPLVTFGMITPTGTEVGQFSADELNTYLSGKLGGPAATRLFETADALGDALASGGLDAAWLTPPAYVRASSKAKLNPIARLSRNGNTSYRSVIFAKADSPLHSLLDLQAHTFAWIGHDSASSNLYPRVLFEKGAMDPEKMFRELLTVENHAEVCQAVLDGKADAGATFSDEAAAGADPVVDGCREAGFDATKFKILARTESIPNDVIATRADLAPEVESHLQSALLAMAQDDKGKAELHDIFHADGFGKSTDADFAPVRAALKLISKK